MLESRDLKPYRDVIEGAYKSLAHPDFSFVKKVFNARPYDPLIKRLRDYSVVEELIEAEDDVCFSFLLKGQSSLWRLDLSVVGPFGLFIRLKAKVASSDFIHAGRDDVTGFESKVLGLLHGAGIKLLTTEELSLQIPMTLYNTARNNVRLYQALFSDREGQPWEA